MFLIFKPTLFISLFFAFNHLPPQNMTLNLMKLCVPSSNFINWFFKLGYITFGRVFHLNVRREKKNHKETKTIPNIHIQCTVLALEFLHDCVT